MIKIPYSESFKRDSTKAQPRLFRTGRINNINAEQWTADVVLEDSQTSIKNVPISLAMSRSEVLVGDRCRLDMLDDAGKQFVIAYTFGRGKIGSVE